jgi:hypothetical protein
MIVLAITAAHVYSEMGKQAIAMISGIEYGSPFARIEKDSEPIELKVGMKLFEDSIIFSRDKGAKISILILQDTTLLTHSVDENPVLLSDIIKPQTVSVTGQLIASIRGLFSSSSETANTGKLGGAADGQLNSHPEARSARSQKTMSQGSKEFKADQFEYAPSQGLIANDSDELASDYAKKNDMQSATNGALDGDVAEFDAPEESDRGISSHIESNSASVNEGITNSSGLIVTKEKSSNLKEFEIAEAYKHESNNNETLKRRDLGGRKSVAYNEKMPQPSSGFEINEPQAEFSNIKPPSPGLEPQSSKIEAKVELQASNILSPAKDKKKRNIKPVIVRHSGMAVSEETEFISIILFKEIRQFLKDNKFIVKVTTTNLSSPKTLSTKVHELKSFGAPSVSVNMKTDFSNVKVLDKITYKISCGNKEQEGWLRVLSAETVEKINRFAIDAYGTPEGPKRRALLFVTADMWKECGAFGNAYDVYRKMLVNEELSSKENQQVISMAKDMQKLYKNSLK